MRPMTPEAELVDKTIGHIKGLQMELRLIETLLEGRTVCGACNGAGGLHRMIDRDDFDDVKCGTCNGRGVVVVVNIESILPKDKIDYRLLIKKYICIVGDAEGTSFIPRPRQEPVEVGHGYVMSPEEQVELSALDAEAYRDGDAQERGKKSGDK